MKAKIHPKYDISQVSCSCGEVFTTRSTSPEIKVEICSKCHPFYSGQQKFVDTAGLIEKFERRFGKKGTKK
ncbi:MAG: 50S ribosomal protein L31 [Actinobacteria bacterium]|nr:MAG: 50S ribosomal protein L31 [Actinomycetota bacterium]